MNKDEWQHELYELVARIKQCQHTKQEIDYVYNKLCTIILSEMDRVVNIKKPVKYNLILFIVIMSSILRILIALNSGSVCAYNLLPVIALKHFF